MFDVSLSGGLKCSTGNESCPVPKHTVKMCAGLNVKFRSFFNVVAVLAPVPVGYEARCVRWSIWAVTGQLHPQL